MLSIRRINFFEYLAAYSAHFPISPVFYGKKVMESGDGGTILLAVEDGDPRGMVFASTEDRVFSVYLISVVGPTVSAVPARIASCENEYIRIETILLDECIRRAVEAGLSSVRYHCTDPVTSAGGRESRLTGMGFLPRCHVFSYRLPFTAENLERWRIYERKSGNRIVQRLWGTGYELRTFEQCGTDMLKRLYGQIGVTFSGELDPRTCENRLDDYSSVVVFHDEPVTFCTVSSEDRGSTVTVEQLSTRTDYRNRGTLVMPLSYAISRAQASGADFMKFDINSANSAMHHILQKFVSPADRYKADYCMYEYSLIGLV